MLNVQFQQGKRVQFSSSPVEVKCKQFGQFYLLKYDKKSPFIITRV